MFSKRALLCLFALLPIACSDDPAPEASAAGAFEGGKADSLAGPITALTCAVPEAHVRPGGFARVEVHATDVEGHASRNYAITVSPSAGTRVVQRNKVIFDHEGSYQLTCCALDAPHCDTAGVQVGRVHPMLVAQSTPFTDDGLVRLSGRATGRDGQTPRVTVNGATLELAADGRFNAFLAVVPGVNAFEVVATDGEGQWSTAHTWSMGGPFQAADVPRTNAARVRLGAEGFSQLTTLLGSAVEGFLESTHFDDLLNHRYEGTLRDRAWAVQPKFFNMGTPDLSLRATAGGLQVAVDLHAITFAATIGGDVPLLGWTEREVTIGLSTFDLSGQLVARDGTLALESAEVTYSDPQVDVPGLPDFLVEATLRFFEDELSASLEARIKAAVETQVAGLAQAFAEPRSVTLPEPLWGALQVHGALEQITLDARGLQAQLAWAVDGDTDPRRADAPGYVITEGEPVITGANPLELALALDAMNAALFAAWQIGALDLALEIPIQDLDRVGEVQVQRFDVFVDPQLPPMARPGDRPGEYLLELGGVRLDGVMETDLGVVNTALIAGATLRARIYIDDAGLNVTGSVEQLVADVLIPPKPLEAEPARRLVEQVLRERVLPRFADVLKTLPIPEADLAKIHLPGTHLRATDIELVPAAPGVLHLEAHWTAQ
jgi:hypothetical protein